MVFFEICDSRNDHLQNRNRTVLADRSCNRVLELESFLNLLNPSSESDLIAK